MNKHFNIDEDKNRIKLKAYFLLFDFFECQKAAWCLKLYLTYFCLLSVFCFSGSENEHHLKQTDFSRFEMFLFIFFFLEELPGSSSR